MNLQEIKKYDIFEIPVRDVSEVVFKQNDISFQVKSFFKDQSGYVVRFMPTKKGMWTYEGTGISGTFLCVESKNNKGPVKSEGVHFKYSDGTVYRPFGTTLYAWTHQDNVLQDKTIATLDKHQAFNKVRMCLFPKSLAFNDNDPEFFPFEKSNEGLWDISKPVFSYWNNLEYRLRQLRERNIEAELILFHPYDKWGFSKMTQEQNLKYINYCINRLSCFSNVWWSLANEYDAVFSLTDKEWDELGRELFVNDPYNHLISIHQIIALLDKKNWMSHLSIQTNDVRYTHYWRQKYNLPTIIDECRYEGNLEFEWGSITGFELVHRFWETMIRGGYCTHGETIYNEDEVIFWSKGGELSGGSPARIAFMKSIFSEISEILDPDNPYDQFEKSRLLPRIMSLPTLERDYLIFGTWSKLVIKSPNYYLQYFGRNTPRLAKIELPKDKNYLIKIIDIWEMTTTELKEIYKGEVEIELPAKEGIVILASKY